MRKLEPVKVSFRQRASVGRFAIAMSKIDLRCGALRATPASERDLCEVDEVQRVAVPRDDLLLGDMRVLGMFVQLRRNQSEDSRSKV